MHQYNFQISIPVHITYKVDLHFNQTNPQSSKILKEVHYYINDDKTHDSQFVQHAFALHWSCLKSKGCWLRHYIVWSDGCLTQFKCARTWYFVVHYPQLIVCEQMLEGVNMCWNYFHYQKFWVLQLLFAIKIQLHVTHAIANFCSYI